MIWQQYIEQDEEDTDQELGYIKHLIRDHDMVVDGLFLVFQKLLFGVHRELCYYNS